MRLFCILMAVLSVASAWTNSPPGCCQIEIVKQDRRNFLGAILGSAATALLAPHAANGDSSDVFKGKLSVEDAKARFQLARKDLTYLLDNYSTISKGGGDAVRNSLGTQGVTSNLYGIQKVLKILQEESEDLIEYSEIMEEFNAYYYQADGAAYQSMFAEHSSAKSTPAELLVTAKTDLVQSVKYMNQLADQLKL